jgi:parallel beta-helix repeat protein
LLIGASATGNLVAGNRVGVGASGATAIPNAGEGVVIEAGAAANTVGGAAGLGNLISGNASNGVAIAGGSGNRVEGNYIGTNESGTAALPNGGSGLILIDSAANTIVNNIVSGNLGFGLAVAGAGSTGNQLRGNFVGATAAGGGGLGNSLSGIVLIGARSNTISGANLVLSNGGDGIQVIDASATGNRIEMNYIGTDGAGAAGGGNAGRGVHLQGAGSTNVAFNLIAGNGSNGVELNSGAAGNVVADNYVGTGPGGATARPNLGSGVFVAGGNANTVSGNVLSANQGFGLVLAGASTTGNTVRNNRVGTDPAGNIDLGNSLDGAILLGAVGNTLTGNQFSFNRRAGVVLRGAASGNLLANNLVGTTAGGDRAAGNRGQGVLIEGANLNTVTGSVVSGNENTGIHVRAGSVGNFLSNNLVGTNLAGTAALPNAGSGILIENATGNTVSGGVISGNRVIGVALTNGSSGNVVTGARVGTNAGGDATLGNGAYGVYMLNSPRNTVRGALVSANAGDNVRVEGAGSTGNVVAGNLIGTNAAGTASLDPDVATVRINPGFRAASGLFVGNDRVAQDLRSDGVVIAGGASANTVGGLSAADRNLISGNRLGVFIRGSSPANVVAGNYIGTDAAGNAMADSQKQTQGVVVLNSSFNTIGGTTTSARNVISGQLETGVRITRLDLDENGDGIVDERRADARLNVVNANYIGTNAAGNAAVGNWQGVFVYGAADNLIGLGSYESETGGNVISGNPNGGVQILNAATANAITVNGQIVVDPLRAGAETTGNIVQGNRVGTSADGLSRVANTLTGIFINDTAQTTVRNNLVSGNGQTGITLFAPESTGNVVGGNRVGTNIAGAVDALLANGWLFANDPPRNRRGPGLFLNQVVSGANTIADNDLRGNVGGPTIEWAIKKGPSVQGVVPIVNGSTGLIETIEITINGYLDRDAARTLNPANYRVTPRPGGAAVGVASVSYDEAARRVTVVLAQGIATTARYNVTVVGTQPAGLRSRPGLTVSTPSVALDGRYNGVPGTDAQFEFVGLTPVAVTTAGAARGR